MSTASPETEIDTLRPSSNGTNNQAVSAENGQPVHQFQPGMADHPLWQMYSDELKAQHEADIAEGNRLADLEMGL